MIRGDRPALERLSEDEELLENDEPEMITEKQQIAFWRSCGIVIPASPEQISERVDAVRDNVRHFSQRWHDWQ
jgi:hypothetical protein